jgi:sulfofructose kinase
MAGIARKTLSPFTFDLLGIGAVAVDDVLYVEEFPGPDLKTHVLRRERYFGGLTSIALVTAARLGSKAAYAGVLGYDDFSEYAVEKLAEEAINLDFVVRHPEARPILSTIIVGDKGATRNIFFYLSEISGAHAELPDASVIRAARVLLVDHLGLDGMLRAARIARAAGIPIVSDLELNVSPHFHELLGLVDHLIMSIEFATLLTGESRPDIAAQKLWSPERKVVVVTCGAAGAWYLSADGVTRHQPSFPVEIVDTNGCGDVFHGAYAACLARGMETSARIRFACAAAALKATHTGGHLAVPTQLMVESLLGK